jgi:hypothetical protein
LLILTYGLTGLLFGSAALDAALLAVAAPVSAVAAAEELASGGAASVEAVSVAVSAGVVSLPHPTSAKDVVAISRAVENLRMIFPPVLQDLWL